MDFVVTIKQWKRSNVDAAPNHALVFLGWYAGTRKVESKDVLLTFHGILSYDRFAPKLLPDSICADEASTAVKDGQLAVYFKVRSQFSEVRGDPSCRRQFSITSDQCEQWIKWLVGLLKAKKKGDDNKETADLKLVNLAMKYVAFLAMNTIRLGIEVATLLTECFCEAEIEKVRNIWRAGCALSLSYTGLGAISWFDKAITCIGRPAIDFLRSISVECFWTFIGYYVSLTQRRDYSWIFCRLIDDTALFFLSVNAMPRETAFFVALAGPQLDIDDEIWMIASLKRLSPNDVATGFAMALGYTQNRMLTSWTGAAFPEALTNSRHQGQPGRLLLPNVHNHADIR